jgi:hypothetical protein
MIRFMFWLFQYPDFVDYSENVLDNLFRFSLELRACKNGTKFLGNSASAVQLYSWSDGMPFCVRTTCVIRATHPPDLNGRSFIYAW